MGIGAPEDFDLLFSLITMEGTAFELDPPTSLDTREDEDGRKQLIIAENTIVESHLILLDFSSQKLNKESG